MELADLAGDHVLTIPVLGQATAGTADEWSGPPAPFRGRITAVKWVPAAAVTADATHYATLSLRNRGAAGAGSTLPASRSYVATNSVAFAPEDMTLSGTSAHLDIAEGDVLTVQKANTGNGLAIPDGVVLVYVQVR
jgi:hypothetical protein